MSEARMLKPEEWETFREGYRLKKCWISYFDTTYNWAVGNNLKISKLLTVLYGIKWATIVSIALIIVNVPINLWNGQALLEIKWGTVIVGALLGLIGGTIRGHLVAYRRAFASRLLTDEDFYQRAVMSSGADIWYNDAL